MKFEGIYTPVITPHQEDGSIDRDGDLESRRQQLGATIAARQAVTKAAKDGPDSSGKTGIGAALKLSSEFIAGILVGVGLGWVIDYWAGTSPWGLIIFLFLGFGAGVLNVMRSVGVVAEAGIRRPDGDGDQSAGT